jgi:hypothetical protein
MVNKYNITIKLKAKILQNDMWVRKKKNYNYAVAEI